MGDNRFGIFYVIARVALAVLTLVAIIFVIIDLVDIIRETSNHYNYDRGSNVAAIIWLFLVLIIFLLGFYGAYKEHFCSILIYATAETVFLLVGIAFTVSWSTRVFPIIAVIIAWILVWMLHVNGRSDYSLPRFN